MSRPDCFLRKAQAYPPGHPKGTCEYCGNPLTGLQRRWCVPSHGYRYREKYTDHVVYWAQFRDEIIERDNYTCRECDRHRSELQTAPEWETLEVHHIIPVSKGGEVFDPENCLTLCTRDHKLRHGKNWQKAKAYTKQLTLEV